MERSCTIRLFGVALSCWRQIFLKKRLITRIGSRVPLKKRMGDFGSSVHRSGGSICGGEVRRGVAQSGQRICFGYRGP